MLSSERVKYISPRMLALMRSVLKTDFFWSFPRSARGVLASPVAGSDAQVKLYWCSGRP